MLIRSSSRVSPRLHLTREKEDSSSTMTERTDNLKAERSLEETRRAEISKEEIESLEERETHLRTMRA